MLVCSPVLHGSDRVSYRSNRLAQTASGKWELPLRNGHGASYECGTSAGEIADTQEDRLVFSLGLLKGLGTPRGPVDRVVGVLLQVWRRLVDEARRKERSPHLREALGWTMTGKQLCTSYSVTRIAALAHTFSARRGNSTSSQVKGITNGSSMAHTTVRGGVSTSPGGLEV